jgi:hypothetical protein
VAGAQTRRSHGGRADTTTGPTRRDELEERRRRNERDDPIRRAYEAGFRGDDPAEHRTSDETAGYYDQGARDRRRQDRRASVGEARDRGVSLANDGAGYVLLDGGIPRVKAWLAAKFINKTADAPERNIHAGQPGTLHEAYTTPRSGE